jgi:hypothetical protein
MKMKIMAANGNNRKAAAISKAEERKYHEMAENNGWLIEAKANIAGEKYREW